MNINYDAKGKDRKALAEAIAKTLDNNGKGSPEIKYLGAPTFAYKVGEHIILDKEGTVIVSGLLPDVVEEIISSLSRVGFEQKGVSDESNELLKEDSQSEDKKKSSEDAENLEAVQSDKADEPDLDRITVSIKNDLTGDEEARLVSIIESKHTLLCKALETDSLPIEIDKDMIRFPWFKGQGIDGEAEAYIQLINAIVKMAKEQKRVTAKERSEENEKFAMRIFTVRLGLKGDKYKLIRKLLSKNLSGNSSWKNGKPERLEDNTKKEAEDNE